MRRIEKFVKTTIAFTLAATVLASCGVSSTPSSEQKSNNSSNSSETSTEEATNNGSDAGTDAADVNTEQKESPILIADVEAGKIPALEKRMPVADDIKVEETEKLGNYGGVATMTFRDDQRWTIGPIFEQNMFNFLPDGSGKVEANVCKSYEANEDYTVWTIELREGMKWSDGEDFNADDVLFYYNHMSTPALNEDRTAVDVDAENYYSVLTSKPYNCYQSTVDGVKYWAEFDKVDDYKFTVTFKGPRPDFPETVVIDIIKMSRSWRVIKTSKTLPTILLLRLIIMSRDIIETRLQWKTWQNI